MPLLLWTVVFGFLHYPATSWRHSGEFDTSQECEIHLKALTDSDPDIDGFCAIETAP